jgi:hypothetical protein
LQQLQQLSPEKRLESWPVQSIITCKQKPMNQVMLIFRRDWETKEKQPSPEQMPAAIKPWQD